MRILMISDVFFPRVNGVSTSILTFQRELARQGHHVTLIAPAYSDNVPAYPWIVRIPGRPIWGDPEDRLMKPMSLKWHCDSILSGSYDLVHIQTPFAAHYAGVSLARRLKLPCVVTYHTYFEAYFHHYVPVVPPPWLRFCAVRFTRSQCNQTNGVIVPSTPIAEVLREYGVKQTTRVIPTGLDLSRLQRGDGQRFRAKFNIAPDRPTLVHVGRVAHEKNIDFLLRVVQRLKADYPDILFVLAGEGPALGAVTKTIEQLGIRENVLQVGYLDRESELLDCYRAANVFVFASRTETQGLVLLESMALGTPVVATAVLGTTDVLQDGLGAVIAKDDVNDFSRHVARLLDNPDHLARLREAARIYASGWGADTMAARQVEFYRETCDRHATKLGGRKVA